MPAMRYTRGTMISLLLLIRAFARTLYRSFKEQPAIRGLLILVVLLLAIGTIFYSQTEHWSILNSLYFCVTTLTTVGLGDLAPKHSISKIFTIIYILFGVGILLGLVNLLAEHAIRVQQERLDRNAANRHHKEH